MKMPKLFSLKPNKKLHAATRRVAQPVMESYDDEPQTKLSSAFIVVLVLHVVAVGGIYAFNSIKAHRRSVDPVAATAPLPATSLKPIPVPEITETEAPLPTEPVAKLPVASSALFSGVKVHHVKSGESLGKIALQHSVSVPDLAEANGIKPTATLRPGQSLNIPARSKVEPIKKPEPGAPKVAATEKKVAPRTYTVAKGDNPVAIARKLNVSYNELLKLNKITDPTKLKIGQPLKIPATKKAD